MSYDSWKAREPEPPECTIHDWGEDEDIPDEELECRRCGMPYLLPRNKANGDNTTR